MRVVSLTCSNTEIVEFLGLGEMLVGVDDHSDYPQELVSSLPRVGPDLGIDVERVLALEPDLVLASLTVPGHEQVVESIRQCGLRYLAPAPRSIADVGRDIREIASALGHGDKGSRLAAEFDRRLKPFDACEPGGASDTSGPSVLVQWWPKPIIAPGAQSWVQGLLDRCGAVNPLASEQVESRPLKDEEAAELDPDVIVLAWCGVEASKVRPDVIRSNPVLADTKAVRNDAIACVPEAWLGRPSPRLVWGAWALERVSSAMARNEQIPAEFRTAASSAAKLAESERWPPEV